MTRLRQIYISLFLFSLSVCAYAQIETGEWRLHPSFSNITNIEQSPSYVYGVSNGSLLRFTKDDYEVSALTKVSGLNGSHVNCITYDNTTGSLIICYADGDIDMIDDDGNVKNIPDIKNANIVANKTPLSVSIDKSTGLAYVCCEIGVVVVNPSKGEIKDTYTIGSGNTYQTVSSATFSDDSIYVLTNDTLMSARKSNNMLGNSNNWKKRYTGISNTVEIKYIDGRLILRNRDGNIYAKETNSEIWNVIYSGGASSISVTNDNNILVTQPNSIAIIKTDGSYITQYNGVSATDAIQDSWNSSKIYAASGTKGIIELTDGEISQIIKPEGPASNDIFSLKYSDGRLFALTGNPRCYSASETSKPGALMIFEDGHWNNTTVTEMYPKTGKNFLSLCYLTVDPDDKTHYFISSLRDGLYEFRDDQFYKRYNTSNSTIEVANENIPPTVTDDYMTICGVAIDNNRRVWLSNELCNSSVKLMDEQGSWHQFSYSGITNPKFMDKVFVSSNNYKWFVKPNRSYSTGGILVLNENDVTISTHGQSYRFISSVTDQDGNIRTVGTVYDLCEDKDGNIWVATESGIFYISHTDRIFSNGHSVTRPKIARNDGTNYADYLLDRQVVRAVATDPANRKWIGTRSSGVYLMSDDGITQLRHFTTANSPLPSDEILSIAIDSESGEVFIATSSGLASYRSDAINENTDLKSIKAFPNPVRPNFSGVVSITGLMDEAVVRITDENGNIVFRTLSNGGEATWNLRNKDGRAVGSGVYYIMASSENRGNTKKGVGKILVIR